MTGPEDDRSRLDELLLGEPPVFTIAEAAERTGIHASVVRRLWRSLGFALPAGDEPAFTTSDLTAIELMQKGTRAGVLDFDTEVRLARALGQTMSRLAEWQVSTLASLVDNIESSPQASGSRITTALRLAEELGDTYDQLLVFAWKRHLGDAFGRLAAIGEVGEDFHMVTNTVGFADIVQFSALSNELDDDRIGDLVEIFETRTSDVVTSLGGRVIKTLGDSVLFVSEDPVAGMDIAHGIIDVIGDDNRLPDVSLGLATGSVILRFGDVFGPPVNLAARLTGIARRNRVITDEATARQLPQTRYETRALTARPVRGFGILEPIAVRRL
jgi:adenylate cyclase